MPRSQPSPRRAPSSGSPSFAFHAREEVPVLTALEAAAFDRIAIEAIGVPSPILMENAGRGAALLLHRLFPQGRVAVFAGPGHNGGDGVVLARTLSAWGREVDLYLAGRPHSPELLHGWSPARLEALPAELPPSPGLGVATVFVDALLGTGARGVPRGEVARGIRALMGASAPVVSLDLPSGVDPTTGAAGEAVVSAAVTVAFGAPKLGTLLFPGRERAGRLFALEIGLPPRGEGHFGAQLVTPRWAAMRRPKRRTVTHKRAEGSLLLLAGSPGMAGAALLAGRGALRGGVGYLRVASPPENREILQRSLPDALFVDLSDEGALLAAARDSSVLVAGPGMGVGGESARHLNALLALPNWRAILLDADGLTLLAEGALPAFRQAAAPPSHRLLTPHPGEMRRLAPTSDPVRDPVATAREGASAWGAVLLLKGTPSLLAPAHSGHPLLLGGTGSSDLARAGMGDLLSGVAGAFLARGCAAAEAGALALHYTGRAAELAEKGEGLLPLDIAETLPLALGEPIPSHDLSDLPFLTLDLPAPR